MTSKLQPPKHKKKTPENTNCLAGMKCPKCGSLAPFNIQAFCMVTVFDNGTEDAENFDWDENSFCSCPKCGYSESIREFTVPEASK